MRVLEGAGEAESHLTPHSSLLSPPVERLHPSSADRGPAWAPRHIQTEKVENLSKTNLFCELSVLL